MDRTGLRTFGGATAVVTGGASGIGRALGEALASRGAEVFLADLQEELAEEAAAGIRAWGGQATACMLDVADYAAVKALAGEAYERTGRLDFIFNNAGIAVGGPPELLQVADWQRIIDVNLYGVVHGVQAAYPIMLRQGFGHIVNTASVAAFLGMPAAIPYSTTKSAVLGLSKSLRAAAAGHGIRVSVLCPGAIRTPILAVDRFSIDRTGLTAQQHLEYWEKYRPMDPADFARQALAEIARNRDIIVIPSWWKRLWWLDRLFPSRGIDFMRKDYEDQLKRNGPKGGA